LAWEKVIKIRTRASKGFHTFGSHTFTMLWKGKSWKKDKSSTKQTWSQPKKDGKREAVLDRQQKTPY